MDMTNYVESESINLDFVKSSPTKKGILLSSGVMAPTKEGQMKPKFLVEIDGKQKYWTMNKNTAKNLSMMFGNESNGWVGRKVEFTVGVVNGKEAVIGKPMV